VKKMATGVALTIGLNSVDPNHYQGWSGPLNACEADAEDMAAIAKSCGFQSIKTLLTHSATRDAVNKAIVDATESLEPGGLFMLSYSGHGGHLPDLDNDEADAEDETWCLYDGELVDDEIYAALSAFSPGVRVLMFSDSCHSGTVARVAFLRDASGSPVHRVASEDDVQIRAMPRSVAQRTYRANRDMYDPILRDPGLRKAIEKVEASILLISGCQDNQYSMDGTFNGLFTGTLLSVWNSGKFKGDYRRFHGDILALMPSTQSPNFYWASQPDLAFERQTPFKI